MKIDATITCRRTSYGPVCDWKGGKVAEVSGLLLEHQSGKRPQAGMLANLGGLKVRVVTFPAFNSQGSPCDIAQVMLESPHAQLYLLYREHAERLVRVLCNTEARIHGLFLQPWEGKIMPFTAWVAKKLL